MAHPPRDTEAPQLNETEARQGRTGQHLRSVLWISFLLAAVVLVIAYLVISRNWT